MQRYFIDQNYQEIAFTSEQTHHIVKVMRMQIGQQLEVVFLNSCYIVEILSLSPIKVSIIKELEASPELNVDITLLYCLPKGDKLDLVIQKATEIGVKQIILVQSSRCISKIKKEDIEKKLARFNKIALEASEQSHRLFAPKIIDIINFKDINKFRFDYSFIAYENERNLSFKDYLKDVKKGQSIGLIIGSEGGFSLEEVEYASLYGYHPLSLGKRILRSETACIYSLSVLSFLLEDL